jgi:hypothetical protein
MLSSSLLLFKTIGGREVIIIMWSILLLNFFSLVPIASYRLARREFPKHTLSIGGMAFGAIATPWAFGLYSWFFLSPLGVIPGFLGLALVSIHEPTGFHLAVYWGLIPRGEGVSGITQHLTVEIINGFVWSIFYGLVGYGIDYVRNKKQGEKRL